MPDEGDTGWHSCHIWAKDVDWSDLENHETEDNTTGSQELACTGGACEIV